MGNLCTHPDTVPPLVLLIDSENWSGALAHLNDASTSEIFYADPQDDNRTGLMKVISKLITL